MQTNEFVGLLMLVYRSVPKLACNNSTVDSTGKNKKFILLRGLVGGWESRVFLMSVHSWDGSGCNTKV